MYIFDMHVKSWNKFLKFSLYESLTLQCLTERICKRMSCSLGPVPFYLQMELFLPMVASS